MRSAPPKRQYRTVDSAKGNKQFRTVWDDDGDTNPQTTEVEPEEVDIPV